MISEVDSRKMGNVIGKEDFKRCFWIFISSEFCQEREKLSILKVHCMCATKKEGEMISGVEIPHIVNTNSIRFC
jgi:hypothetical protein